MAKTPPTQNLPVWSLGSAVILVAMAIVGLGIIDLDENSSPIFLMIVGLIVTTVPSLISAAYSERISRDIRNGTVTEKVKDALDEKGVTEAVQNANEMQPATLNALQTQTRSLNLLLTQLVADENTRKLDRKETP